MLSQADTTDGMATSLIDHGIDLSDPREVILHLISVGYLSGQINELMDAAIIIAESAMEKRNIRRAA